jgi:hypothetical protein
MGGNRRSFAQGSVSQATRQRFHHRAIPLEIGSPFTKLVVMECCDRFHCDENLPTVRSHPSTKSANRRCVEIL